METVDYKKYMIYDLFCRDSVYENYRKGNNTGSFTYRRNSYDVTEHIQENYIIEKREYYKA